MFSLTVYVLPVAEKDCQAPRLHGLTFDMAPPKRNEVV